MNTSPPSGSWKLFGRSLTSIFNRNLELDSDLTCMDVKQTDPPPTNLNAIDFEQSFEEEQQRRVQASTKLSSECDDVICSIPPGDTATPWSSTKRNTKQVKVGFPSVKPQLNSSIILHTNPKKGSVTPVVPAIRAIKSPSLSPLKSIAPDDATLLSNKKKKISHLQDTPPSPTPGASNLITFSPSPSPSSKISNFYEAQLLQKRSRTTPKEACDSESSLIRHSEVRTTSLPYIVDCKTRYFNGAVTSEDSQKLISKLPMTFIKPISSDFKDSVDVSIRRKSISTTMHILMNKKSIWNDREKKNNNETHFHATTLDPQMHSSLVIVSKGSKSPRKFSIKRRASKNQRCKEHKQTSQPKKTEQNTEEDDLEEFVDARSLCSSQDSSYATFTDVFGEQKDSAAQYPERKRKLTNPQKIFYLDGQQIEEIVVPKDEKSEQPATDVNKPLQKTSVKKRVLERANTKEESHLTPQKGVVRAVASKFWQTITAKKETAPATLGKTLLTWEKSMGHLSALAAPSIRKSRNSYIPADNDHEFTELSLIATVENVEKPVSHKADVAKKTEEKKIFCEKRHSSNVPDGVSDSMVIVHQKEKSITETIEMKTKKEGKFHVTSSKCDSDINDGKIPNVYNLLSEFVEAHSLDHSAIAALLYVVSEEKDNREERNCAK